MFAYPLRTAALAIGALVGLSACTTGYGYNGVSVGVGNAGYYDPYYGGYGYGGGYPASGYGYGAGYPGYGYGYGSSPYFGWYDGLYYPGTGYYVYDGNRNRYRWSDRHRRYWEGRRERTLAEGFRNIGTNWSQFDRNTAAGATQVQRSVDSPTRIIRRRTDRTNRIERNEARSEQGAVRGERQPTRAERQTARSERQTARAERQSSRSEARSSRESRSNARSRDNNREQ